MLRIPTDWLKRFDAGGAVVAMHGDVTRSMRTDSPFESVAVGTPVASGSRLRTGIDSSATLRFADGSRVQLLPDTELSIVDSTRFSTDAGNSIRLDLVRGAVETFVVPRTGATSRFEIRTPAAVAAVRGTDFRVGVDQAQARSEVLGGNVEFGNAAGRRVLRPGFGTLAQPDVQPAPPVPLLPAPDLGDVPRVIERVPFDVAIPAIPAAAAYRTQLVVEKPSETIVASAVGAQPRVRVADLPDGDYVARVRAIDARGLEGFDASIAITIHARPEPPVLIDPAPDGVVTAERPTLRWANAGSSMSYQVQVSADDRFDGPAIAVPATDDVRFQPTLALVPGVYRWRVASVDAVLGRGPFSDPQSFRRALPAPGIEPPEMTSDALTLRWRAAPDGTRYTLQLSRDADFGQPLVNEVVDVPRYKLATPESGTYHLRVNAIASDGVAGPWGSTQTFVVPHARPSLWPLLLFLPFLLLL